MIPSHLNPWPFYKTQRELIVSYLRSIIEYSDGIALQHGKDANTERIKSTAKTIIQELAG